MDTKSRVRVDSIDADNNSVPPIKPATAYEGRVSEGNDVLRLTSPTTQGNEAKAPNVVGHYKSSPAGHAMSPVQGSASATSILWYWYPLSADTTPPGATTMAATLTDKQRRMQRLFARRQHRVLARREAAMLRFTALDTMDDLADHFPDVFTQADPTGPWLTRLPRHAGVLGRDVLRHGTRETSPRTARLALHTQFRQEKAASRRATYLHRRRDKLRQTHARVRGVQVLVQQRHRLAHLRLKAKAEFSQTSAYLKRQIILQRHVERCGATVTRAQGIAILNKLQKYLTLRKSCSHSFLDTLQEAQASAAPTATTQDGGAGDGASRHHPVLSRHTSHVTASPAAQALKQHLDAAHPDHARTDTAPADEADEASVPLPPSLRRQRRQRTPDVVTSNGGVAPPPLTMGLHSPVRTDDGSFEDDVDVWGSPASPAKGHADATVPAATTASPTRLRRSSSAPLHTSLKAILAQAMASDGGATLPDAAPGGLGAMTRLLDATDLVALLPPITRFTLRELDFDEILGNVQLRHDLLFDPGLQFRPNDEGPRAGVKAEAREAYWEEVRRDVAHLATLKAERVATRDARRLSVCTEGVVSGATPPVDTDGASPTKASRRRSSQWMNRRPNYLLRLPMLINEIREIMLELLPYSNEFHEELNANLDVDLMAQQLEHSNLDALPIIEYIGRTLKIHCAPVRDDKIDEMVATLRDTGDIVGTLRMCFSILELMKLDIANHQLRRIRPYVQTHAANFEWQYFREQVRSGVTSTDVTKEWMRGAMTGPDPFGLSKTLTQVAAGQSAGLKASSSHASLAAGGLQRAVSKNLGRSALSLGASAPDLTRARSAADVTSGTTTPTTDPTGDKHLPGQWIDTYYQALLRLIVSPAVLSTERIPETFHLDHSRLQTFHNDWQDITILSCLLVLFRQAAGPRCTPTDVASCRDVLWVLLNDADTTLPHITLQLLATAERVRGTTMNAGERKVLTTMIDKTLSPDSTLFTLMQNRIAVHVFVYLRTEQTLMRSSSALGTLAASGMGGAVADPTQGIAGPIHLTKSSSSLSLSHVDTVSATGTTAAKADDAAATTAKRRGRVNKELLQKHGLAQVEDDIVALAEKIKGLADHNRVTYATFYQELFKALRQNMASSD